MNFAEVAFSDKVFHVKIVDVDTNGSSLIDDWPVCKAKSI